MQRLLIAASFGSLLLSGCSSGTSKDTDSILKSKKLTVEYGTKLDLKKADLFAEDQLDQIESFDVDTSAAEIDPKTGTPAIQEFKAPVEWSTADHSGSDTLTISIKDTSAPKILSETAAVPAGDAKEARSELEAQIESEDLSVVTIKALDEDVDYSKAGTATIKIQATDASGNISDKEIEVRILTPTAWKDYVDNGRSLDQRTLADANIADDKDDSGKNNNDSQNPDENADGIPAGQETGSHSDHKGSEINDDENAENPAGSNPVSAPGNPSIQDPGDGSPVLVNGIPVVNKTYGISPAYNPGEDPTAGSQIRALIAEMQSLGYDIGNSYSGFRSYDYQSQLYNNYVAANGQASADTFSARPGFSEHQTGLAFDLKNYGGALVTSQPEADWIAQNAHRYGFIVRYTEEKQPITGYMAEPWHLRYIGPQAEDIYKSGLCLEEYLGLGPAEYQ